MDECLVYVPAILFMIFVAPLWVVMHYRSKNKKESGISKAEHERLQELLKIADSMLDRVEVLESILDHEVPGWRKTNERT